MGAGTRKYSQLSRIPFLGMFAKLRQVTISFVMSVHPFIHRNNLAPTGWIFMKFDIWVLYKNLSRKLKFHYNRTRIVGTLHEDQHTCLIIFANFFLEWEMFQTKVVEKIRAHFILNNLPPTKSCLLWDNVGKYCRARQATDDGMAHAHCMLDT